MNYETVDHPLWPYGSHHADAVPECSGCFNDLNEAETFDPCIIDGRIFCDSCASEYIAFRCGTLRKVSDMTHELRMNLNNGYDLTPIHEVMHDAFKTILR